MFFRMFFLRRFSFVLAFISVLIISSYQTDVSYIYNTVAEDSVVATPKNDSEVNDLLKGNLTNVIQEGTVSEVDGDLKDEVDFATADNSSRKKDTDENTVEVTNANTNDTVEHLGNVTALPVVMEPGDEGSGPAVGTTESAVILAATFLILAAVGYGGMVAWRRMLQVKYGASDMLITDDVYDITDLRNFEI